MRCSGECGHQPGVPEKGLESPSRNAKGSREWGGWREPEAGWSPPLRSTSPRGLEEEEQRGREIEGPQADGRQGTKTRRTMAENTGWKCPRGPAHKGSSKAIQSVSAPREPDKGSIFCFTSPFIVCTRVGGICLLHCSTAHIFLVVV